MPTFARSARSGGQASGVNGARLDGGAARASQETDPHHTRQTPNGRSKRSKLTHRFAPYLLLSPAIILIMIVLGYPMLRQFVMSFQKFGLAQQFGKPADWVWFDNYMRILGDPYFWSVLVKSLLFCFWTAGITMVFALVFAFLMRQASSKVRTVMNVALVVVWAMPLLASLTVWQWLVDPNFGLVNYILESIGLQQFENFSWLAESYWTFYLVASAVITWASVPLCTISIYAALTQVDDSLVEAATIDGANYRQRLKNVFFPTIMPVVALIGVLQIIWDLRVFTQIYVLQQSGGISTKTNLLGTYVYEVGISRGDYGTAAAISTIILLVTLVITARYIQMLFKQKGEV